MDNISNITIHVNVETFNDEGYFVRKIEVLTLTTRDLCTDVVAVTWDDLPSYYQEMINQSLWWTELEEYIETGEVYDLDVIVPDTLTITVPATEGFTDPGGDKEYLDTATLLARMGKHD